MLVLASFVRGGGFCTVSTVSTVSYLTSRIAFGCRVKELSPPGRPTSHTQEHTIGKIPNFRARQNSKMNVPTLFFKALKMHIPRSSIVTNPVYKIWMLPLLYKALTKIEQLDRSVGGEVFCRCDTGT